MRTKQILKAFLICALVYIAGLLLVSCNEDFNPEPQFKEGKDITVTTQNSKTTTTIEYITGPLKNDSQSDNGLYKVTLEDGREILIYRGVESVSMIQLK